MRRKPTPVDGNRFPSETEPSSVRYPRHVREVPVETRSLVVIPPERFGEDLSVEGAIVWIIPTPHASPEDVSQYETRVRGAGAVVVRVIGTVRAPAEEMVRVRLLPTATVRETVDELIGALSEDVREPARGIVETCMSQVGL